MQWKYTVYWSTVYCIQLYIFGNAALSPVQIPSSLKMGSDILYRAPSTTWWTPHPTCVPALHVRLPCPGVRTSSLAHKGPHFILGHLSQIYTLPTLLRLWRSSLGLHLESNFLLGWSWIHFPWIHLDLPSLPLPSEWTSLSWSLVLTSHAGLPLTKHPPHNCQDQAPCLSALTISTPHPIHSGESTSVLQPTGIGHNHSGWE